MDQPHPEAAAPVPPSALRHLASHVRLWVVAALALGLDLWSKDWAFRALKPNEVRAVIPNFLEFRRSLNDGAVLGAFTGYVSLFIVASVGALLFVLYLFAHSPRTHRGLHVALGLILAGAMGNLYDRIYMQADVVTFRTHDGEVGSLIGKVVSDDASPMIRLGHWPLGENPRNFQRDEVTIRRQGVVRDFLKFTPRFPEWVPKLSGFDMWPWIFNVADAALVCGVFVLLLHSWMDRRAHAATASPLTNPETAAASACPDTSACDSRTSGELADSRG